MLQQSNSFLGVVTLGSTAVLLVSVFSMASGDRYAPVGAASIPDGVDQGGRERSAAPSPHTIMAGSSDDCAGGALLQWLGEVRPLPECFGYFDGFDSTDPADWNDDGEIDFVRADYSGGALVDGGVPQPPRCILYVSTLDITADGPVMTRDCVARSDALISYAATHFPGSSVEVGEYYWRDLDRDGDLDVAVGFRVDGNFQAYEWVWLENTGYESSGGQSADINGDGAVDGKDLAAVLSGWTG